MKVLLLFVLLFALSGCGATTEPQISMKPPAYVEELPPKQSDNIEVSAGSLFGKGDNPLFSDKKAMNVNDLVTVVIQESTSQTTQANRATSKTNNSNLGGATLSAGGALGRLASMINDYSSLGFQTNSTANYTGQGSQSRNESFNTTISTSCRAWKARSVLSAACPAEWKSSARRLPAWPSTMAIPSRPVMRLSSPRGTSPPTLI